ncbi:hypothetical protein B0H13DRAFT_1907386 [Mycena leptocephala]|nr:hypothetical protein B0H13DRAFT_1907386 [Mycena leptocephala]
MCVDVRTVSFLGFMIYEHIVCIPEEVELMWRSRWGIAKIIYLWSRYFSLVAVSLNTCARPMFVYHPLIWFIRDEFFSRMCLHLVRSKRLNNEVQGSTSTVLIMTVDFVLMLRFSYSPSNAIVELTANYSNLQSLDPIWKAEMDGEVLCVPGNWSIIKTFIMFVMTLYKCVLTMYRMEHRVMPVWRLFLRDGVVWFVLVFAAGGSELLIWNMRRETLKQILVVWVYRLLPSSNSSHTVFLNSLQPRSCLGKAGENREKKGEIYLNYMCQELAPQTMHNTAGNAGFRYFNLADQVESS